MGVSRDGIFFQVGSNIWASATTSLTEPLLCSSLDAFAAQVVTVGRAQLCSSSGLQLVTDLSVKGY